MNNRERSIVNGSLLYGCLPLFAGILAICVFGLGASVLEYPNRRGFIVVVVLAAILVVVLTVIAARMIRSRSAIEESLDTVRLLFAGLLIMVGAPLAVITLVTLLDDRSINPYGSSISRFLEHVGPVGGGTLGGIGIVVLCIVVTVAFNRHRIKPGEGFLFADWVTELDEQNLIESTVFKAVRGASLVVDEDIEASYIIELVGGSLLYLEGEYLWNNISMENCDTDNDVISDPFPCTEFIIRRHRETGEGLALICSGFKIIGDWLEYPESTPSGQFIAAPFDGDIITSITYDELIALSNNKSA